jgi:hypothetical protein
MSRNGYRTSSCSKQHFQMYICGFAYPFVFCLFIADAELCCCKLSILQITLHRVISFFYLKMFQIKAVDLHAICIFYLVLITERESAWVGACVRERDGPFLRI